MEQLHDYQGEAVEFLYNTPFSAAFMDTGLGKTSTILTLLNRLFEREETKRVLIIAPIRVANQTWPNEIKKWSHTWWMSHSVLRAEDDDPEVISAGRAAREAFKNREDIGDLAEARRKAQDEVEWLTLMEDGPQAQDALKAARERLYAIPTAQQADGKARTAMKETIRQRKLAEKTDIHIIDIEHIEWLIDQFSEWKEVVRRGVRKRKREVVNWPYDTVIIDESSKFKDHKTDRYAALVSTRIKPQVKRLHELTATPAAESYMGLFAQIYLLDRGERLGNNITFYRDTYFRLKPRSKYVYELMPGMQEVISDKIADLCLVMKARDYIKTEEPLFLSRKINMTPEQLKQYKTFEREFILETPEGELIEAVSAGALSGKLLQLASGAVYDEKKRYHIFHDHKLEDLEELVEELSENSTTTPLLVSYWYKSSLDRLKKRFPKAIVADKQGKFVKPWNEGKIKMLLVHPASIGHGLNMQAGPGHNIYFYDMCWSYELYYQLYCRLHRQGQKYRVNVHLPQIVGTNDVLVADRLLEKEDAQEFLFDRIRAYRKRLKALNDNRQRVRMAA
jgi:hypothetical protein